MDRVEYQPLLIQDLINLHKRDELNLNPWYQRRAVWTPQQKSYLINTIMEQKPVPSLYIRHSLDMIKEKSIKEVVDGQQRIRSVIEFTKDAFTARHPNHKKKVLYNQMTAVEREKFLITSLSVGYLIGATDADVIEIFGRLNSVSKTLNPQEKRNAKYGGEFKQFCLSEAARRVNIWRELGIFSATDISRMIEVQFVAELAINIMCGLQDYNANQIDQIYKNNDDKFDAREDIEKRMEAVFQKIAQIHPSAIKDTIFSRSPLFFTLFLIIDSIKANINEEKIEETLFEIDKIFNADTPMADRGQEDADFYVSCTSNMHRIKSRKIREEYVRKFLLK